MSPRDRILARRAKFVAAALAGVGVVGCSSAQVCLEPSISDAGTDTSKPQTSTTDTGTPNPCLSIAVDTGTGDADASVDTADTEPTPCLVPPLDGG